MNVPAWRPEKADSCWGKGSLCVKVSARLGENSLLVHQLTTTALHQESRWFVVRRRVDPGKPTIGSGYAKASDAQICQ